MFCKTMMMTLVSMVFIGSNGLGHGHSMMQLNAMKLADVSDLDLPPSSLSGSWMVSGSGSLSSLDSAFALWQQTTMDRMSSVRSIWSRTWSSISAQSRSESMSLWRSRCKDVMQRYLGWSNGGDSYDLSRSLFSQDAEQGVDAKTAYFWFITVFSNSFAVAFGLKAALQGVHPKFHFSTKLARSMTFHIVIGSLEFVWVVVMYLSVPRWWHCAVLVALDTIQNVTIWLQMGSSQGVKLVTNSCYLFCLVVKAAMCCGLLLVDPFSRDLVWGIYEILSAFTLTRISGMCFKKLGLFKGQMYTLAVFTATMMSFAQAFGNWGPVALFTFLCAYSAAHSAPQHNAVRRKRKSARKQSAETATATVTAKESAVSWTEEARRNPFSDEHSMKLVQQLLTEGDDQRASKLERARTVFHLITKRKDARWMTQEQLAAVLCPSGVPLPEVASSFAELSTVDPVDGQRGIEFQTFFSALPTVWDWYFDYIYESVFRPERQIR